MSDREVRRVLRDLPRAAASRAFTARVLERLDEPSARAPVVPRLILAAALLLLVAIPVTVHEWSEARQERQSRARVEALRQEYERLEGELELLRRLAADARPVVQVGGSDVYDVFVDPREWTDPSAVPAARRVGWQEEHR